MTTTKFTLAFILTTAALALCLSAYLSHSAVPETDFIRGVCGIGNET